MTDKLLDSIIDRMGKGREPTLAVFDRMTMTPLGDVLKDFYNAEMERPNSKPSTLLMGMTIGLSSEHSFFFNNFLKDGLSDEAAEVAAEKYLKGYSKSFMMAMKAGRRGQKRRAETE